MKTKIGLPFGLALVMFLGVFTIMLALGTLNPQSAQAQAAAQLTTLTVQGEEDAAAVDLTPAFAGAVNIYTVAVAKSSSTYVTVGYEPPTVTVEFLDANGNMLTDAVPDTGMGAVPGFQVMLAGQVTQSTESMTVIQIRSTASGETKTYEVTVTRPAADNDPSLDTLTFTPDVSLAPTFAAGSTDYTGSVDIGDSPATPTMVTVTPTAMDEIGANVEIMPADASAMTEGHQVSLIPGRNVVTVMVTAEDGSTMRTYTIVITRGATSQDPTLSSLMLSDGVMLDPTFSSSGLMYTASVEHTVSKVTVTPTATQQGPFASPIVAPIVAVRLGGATIAESTTMAGKYDVNLAEGLNTITIVVNALGSDGTAAGTGDAIDATLTYTVEVTRAAVPPVGDAVTATMVTNSPMGPGAAAEYTITFVTGVVLQADTGQIILDIDSSVGVPTSLSPSAVRIRASDIDGHTDARPNQNRPLELAPVYRVIPGTDGRKEYKIRIPNMDGVPENPVADIAAGATVTLTLLANSGFTNPTEANVVVFEEDGVTRDSGGDDFKVSTNKQSEGVSYFISTPLELFSDDKADNRNKPLTVTGKGFKNGTTAIVYLEETVNGEVKETDLISILVGSDDTFDATFNVTVPPFKAGKGNMIKAKDGETPPNRTDTAVAFEVEGLLTASPKTASIGDKIQISLTDWPPYTTDNPEEDATVKIAGIEQKIIGSMSVANGKATFQIEIGNDVPSGTEELQVDAAGESDSTNVVISGADLTVTPSTVVPNQNVTAVGQGFGDRAEINTGDPDDTSSVEFGGDPAHLEVDSDNFNNGEGIITDSGGNWNASIVIPITGASTTEGTHTLDVKDSSGRSGSAEVVIAERKVTLDPPTARPGVMVQLTGSGFPASNRRSEQTAPPVSIEYGDDLVGTVNPDSSGNIATSFRVPFDASIPSSNTVTVKFTYTQNNANFDVIEHFTHEVPGATISLSASEGKPGDTITVTGEGFAQHASISSMSIGTIDILPSPKPSTSSEGTFTTSVLIPGIDLGTHSIEVEISDTVASAVFRVVEETTTMMPEVMMAEEATPGVAFAAVIAEDNLISVFHFDPATQNEAPNYGYTVYDARPLFMSGNNLDSIEPEEFYTVQVSEDQMGVTLGSQTVDLYAPFTPIRW